MSKKKIILIVCLAAAVIASAVTTIFFVKRSDNNEIKTPIPVSIDTESASTFPASLSDVTVKKDALTEVENTETANLYSVTYKLKSFVSEKTYITDAGLTASEQKINEYYDLDTDELVYTVVIDKELSATYDNKGTIVRCTGDYSPVTDYDTDDVTWFFKDGTVSCGEMSFYDVNGNFGTAYYKEDGSLAGVVTEVYPVEDGEPTIVNTYYDSTLTQISEEAFMLLVPKTDVDSFLYINW